MKEETDECNLPSSIRCTNDPTPRGYGRRIGIFLANRDLLTGGNSGVWGCKSGVADTSGVWDLQSLSSDKISKNFCIFRAEVNKGSSELQRKL